MFKSVKVQRVKIELIVFYKADLDRYVFTTPCNHALHIWQIEKTVPLEQTIVRHGIAINLMRLCLSRERAIIRIYLLS